MNLVLQAKACQDNIQRLEKLKSTRQHIKYLEERKTSFGQLKAQLQAEMQKANTLALFNFSLKGLSGRCNKLGGTLATLDERVSQDPTFIVQTFQGQEARGLFEEIEGLAKEIRSQTETFWQRYSTEHIRTLDNDLLLALERIPAFSATVRKFKDSVVVLREASRSVPSNSSQAKNIQQFMNSVEASWKELEAADIPQDVFRFLKAAASNEGVGLDQINKTVWEWLSEYDLLGKFRVKSRN